MKVGPKSSLRPFLHRALQFNNKLTYTAEMFYIYLFNSFKII